MHRLAASLWLWWYLALPLVAVAQTGAIAPQNARDALAILQNVQRRAELISTLEAIAAAQSVSPTEPEPGLAPGSPGAQLLHGVATLPNEIARHAQENFLATGLVPWLGSWLLAPVLVLLAVWLTGRWLGSWLARKLDTDTDLAASFLGLNGRARIYRPVLRVSARLIVALLGLILLLEIWGFAPVIWLTGTRAGRELLAGFGSIGGIVLLAFVVWEAIHLAFVRHLARLADQAQAARSARLRTLLPLLRTVLLIAIVIIVSLTVLSQIGINIAPLLAGAGVLGIAIGFGSQKLVQDVITGIFLLLENAMQVGDVVTLAGVTGVVEELTIRSIRLRAEDGAVQIIPFSAVTTVTNMTRDFSQAVIEVHLDYKDDYDRVVDLLRAIAAEMRAEPAWETEILADMEVMGLIRFEPSAMVVKCRLKCGPFARWKVQREFFRRMKSVFAGHGIAPPSPVQKLVLEAPSTGGAPR